MGSVVYTSIFGGYNKLKDPTVYSSDIDYVCFTDRETRSDVWDVRVVELYRDFNRSAKRFKVGPHVFLREYEYSLWVDGNMTLKVIPDIKGMLDGKTIALMKHQERDCIYNEGIQCIYANKDWENKIDRQLETYYNQDYPAGAGLYSCSLIPRKHNDNELASLNELWWHHICIYSTRDQISFPVVFSGYPIGDISHKMWCEMVDVNIHSRQSLKSN